MEGLCVKAPHPLGTAVLARADMLGIGNPVFLNLLLAATVRKKVVRRPNKAGIHAKQEHDDLAQSIVIRSA